MQNIMTKEAEMPDINLLCLLDCFFYVSFPFDFLFLFVMKVVVNSKDNEIENPIFVLYWKTWHQIEPKQS